MVSVLPPPVWVDRPAPLEHLARELRPFPRLAVDTESNSLHAYHEQVCLIQFSTPNTDYLVDPLDLTDLSPLAPIFADPGIEKVFHAVEYDLICLNRDFGFEIANIFDTMQSARILGYPQVGLDALLGLKFDLKVDKRYQKADWAYRPLTPEMLNYARLDTHYLLALRNLLQVELEAAGRWDLAREEFVRLAKLNGNGKPELPSWQRVSGIQKYDGQELAILKELCDWRDQTAKRLARPTFKVMDDKRLAAIALAAPERSAEFEGILSEYQRRRFGAEILKAVTRGLGAPPITLPRHVRPRQAYLNRANALSQWRKQLGRKLHMESDIILPKGWMHAIAEKNPRNLEELAALMPDSPWRIGKFGEQILKVIR
jgi:ribonuclease D